MVTVLRKTSAFCLRVNVDKVHQQLQSENLLRFIKIEANHRLNSFVKKNVTLVSKWEDVIYWLHSWSFSVCTLKNCLSDKSWSFVLVFTWYQRNVHAGATFIPTWVCAISSHFHDKIIVVDTTRKYGGVYIKWIKIHSTTSSSQFHTNHCICL